MSTTREYGLMILLLYNNLETDHYIFEARVGQIPKKIRAQKKYGEKISCTNKQIKKKSSKRNITNSIFLLNSYFGFQDANLRIMFCIMLFKIAVVKSQMIYWRKYLCIISSIYNYNVFLSKMATWLSKIG